jgi:hypothetical protein
MLCVLLEYNISAIEVYLSFRETDKCVFFYRDAFGEIKEWR